MARMQKHGRYRNCPEAWNIEGVDEATKPGAKRSKETDWVLVGVFAAVLAWAFWKVASKLVGT